MSWDPSSVGTIRHPLEGEGQQDLSASPCSMRIMRVFLWSGLCTVMTPLGALGCSQFSSSARPCSLCSTVKLARPDGEASRVLTLTHGLNTPPERDKTYVL